MKSRGKGRIIVSFLLITFIYNYLRSASVVTEKKNTPSTGNSSLLSVRCPLRDRLTILNSVLPVNENGRVNLSEGDVSRCLIIDKTKLGVYRFMDERNFEGVTCNTTTKRFLEDGEMPITILQSFPGSGNTWTRHLIEEMTGFYTGSIHMDKTLKQIFPGEKNVSNVIAAKSHKRYEQIDFHYDKVILLIRKPYDTILSFFNWYRTKTHTGFESKENFNREEFVAFFRTKIKLYQTSYIKWLENHKGKLLVQFYHELKTDLLNSLTRIASFLGTKVTLSKLWCLSKTQKGSFERAQRPRWFIEATKLEQEEKNILSKTEGAVFEACQKGL